MVSDKFCFGSDVVQYDTLAVVFRPLPYSATSVILSTIDFMCRPGHCILNSLFLSAVVLYMLI